MRIHGDRTEYAVVIHDGMGIVGSEHDVYMRPSHAEEDRDRHRLLIDKLLKRAKEYSQARGHTVGQPLLGQSFSIRNLLLHLGIIFIFLIVLICH